MKKILSAGIVFAMLLTSLGIFPAQAAPYEGYPYVYEDFEEGLGSVTKNGSIQSLTHVSGGAGDSAGAALAEIVSEKYADVEVACTVAPGIGDKLKFSVWVKLDNTDLKQDTMSFIVYGRGTVYKTDPLVEGEEKKEVACWKQINVHDQGLKKGEWVKVTYEAIWDGTMVCQPGVGYNGVTDPSKSVSVSEILQFTKLAVRIGSLGGTVDMADTTQASLRYYVDDLMYEVAPADTSSVTVPGTNIISNGEFDVNTEGWSSEGKMTIVSDPDDPAPDGSAGYLKLEPKSADTPYFAQMVQKMTWQPNHVYKISYYAKIFSTTEPTTQGGAWLLQLAINSDRIPDVNGVNTEYPGYVADKVLNVGGGWQKVEYYYVHEYKTFVEQPFTTWLRIYPDGKKDNVAIGVYGLDSVQMIDLGPISNGDFEIGEAQIVRNSTRDKTDQSVLGWTANNATIAQADSARPGSEGAKSMQVTVNTDGGYAFQGLSMAADKKYKLSFWAKGENLSADTPFALVLDRKVDAPGGDSECYEVPDYQYYTGTNEVCEDYTDEVKQSQQWKLTNEWQKYECYIDNTFPLKDGMSLQDNIIPRLPFLYLDVNGNTAGTTYYLDDMNIEEIITVPVVSNANIVGRVIPGNNVSVDYTFSSSEGYEDTYSFVRIFNELENGTVVSLGSFKADSDFVIPESVVGKNLVFEILPIDETGQCGNPVRIAAPDPGTWAKIYVNDDGTSVRIYASEQMSAKVIFAAYKDKELISVGMQDVSLTADAKTDVSAPADFVSSAADTVKAMLWNGFETITPLCSAELLK